jgi:hypothetical protein
MKWFSVAILFLLIGCSSEVTDQQVINDSMEILSERYEFLEIRNLDNVAFGDGWDDGVEVSVSFDAKCKSLLPPSDITGGCRSGRMRMHLSYQKNADGKWSVLSSELVSADP